jgi:CBS domain containing-hemolysin-like protein
MFSRPKTITALLRPLPLIPETMTADDILKLLLDQRKGMAVVVDEYGGTAGLVSIEDIMEQIFGEIEDEHDHEELLESQIDEHSFHFSSRLEVDYVNKTYSLNLPANESYETLAGMVMHLTGNIPNEGEIIDLPGYRITILQNSQHKIDAVRIDILSENS